MQYFQPKLLIEFRLLINGSISVESLTEYSEMVLRSKDEVLQLFKDKGNEFVKSKLRQI